MKNYTQKHSDLVVEAAQIGEEDINILASWARAQVVEEKDAITHEVFEALNVRTPEGTKRASHGMYVVKVGGHFFVAQPGEFEANFDPLTDPAVTNETPLDLFRGPRQI